MYNIEQFPGKAARRPPKPPSPDCLTFPKWRAASFLFQMFQHIINVKAGVL